MTQCTNYIYLDSGRRGQTSIPITKNKPSHDINFFFIFPPQQRKYSINSGLSATKFHYACIHHILSSNKKGQQFIKYFSLIYCLIDPKYTREQMHSYYCTCINSNKQFLKYFTFHHSYRKV